MLRRCVAGGESFDASSMSSTAAVVGARADSVLLDKLTTDDDDDDARIVLGVVHRTVAIAVATNREK